MRSRNVLSWKCLCAAMALFATCAGCGDPSVADRPATPSESIAKEADGRTDEVLVAEALDESTGRAGPLAVQVLAQRTSIDQSNPTREHLRQVFTHSESPPVRVAAIDGIAKGWDYDAMDDLFAALDDESVEVRERAGKAVQKMIGLRFPYNASDPPAERAEVVAHMRVKWDALRTTGKLDQWLQRLPEVHGRND